MTLEGEADVANAVVIMGLELLTWINHAVGQMKERFDELLT